MNFIVQISLVVSCYLDKIKFCNLEFIVSFSQYKRRQQRVLITVIAMVTKFLSKYAFVVNHETV